MRFGSKLIRRTSAQILSGRNVTHAISSGGMSLIALAMAFGFLFRGTSAISANSMQISQIADAGQELVVFIRRADEGGTPPPPMAPASLEIAIGSLQLPVKEVTSFTSANMGMAIVLAMDVSASIPKRTFEQIKNAVTEFARSTSPKTRIAIIAIGTKVDVLSEFSSDMTAIAAALQKLSPTDQETSLYEAIVRAQEVAARIDSTLPVRRAVFVVTDGLDDSRRGYSKDEVMQRIGASTVPVYSVGLVTNGKSVIQQDALRTLAHMSRESGGRYVQANPEKIAAEIGALRKTVEAVELVKVDCSKCIRDGSLRRLQVVQKDGAVASTDSRDIRLLAPSAAVPSKVVSNGKTRSRASETWFEAQQVKYDRVVGVYPWMPWVVGAVVFIGLSGAIGWWWRARSRRRALLVDSAPLVHGWASALQMPGAEGFDGRSPDRTLEHEVATTVRYQGGGRQITFAVAGYGTKVIGLGPPIAIGRASDNAIAIENDSEASSHHAEIVDRQGTPVLGDLGSTNGCYLNGTKIRHPEPLSDGDLILIGRTEIRVYFS